MSGPPDKPVISWGIAASACPGETESGDLHLVKLVPGGGLVAVVDGLGHGSEAAAAARMAVAAIADHAHEPVVSLIQRCHESLRRTRGVVMSLASFDGSAGAMTWVGVGNVEGVLIRGGRGNHDHESLLTWGGLIGYQLPSFRPSTIPVWPGDTLVFATDGIRRSFSQGLSLDDSPQQAASGILARYNTSTDDALVLVVRYLGNAP